MRIWRSSVRLALTLGLAAAMAVGSSLLSPPRARADQTLWPLELTAYNGVIYEMLQGAYPNALSYADWKNVYNFRAPTLAPVTYQKYAWLDEIFAVTNWPTPAPTTSVPSPSPITPTVDVVSYAQWRSVGSPTPQTMVRLAQDRITRYTTSPELFLTAPGPTPVRARKLSWDDWVALGQPSPEGTTFGLYKLSWAPYIVSIDSATGIGETMSYAEWADRDHPTPQNVSRLPGDAFELSSCGSNVEYVAPQIGQIHVTYAMWAAAGFPALVSAGVCWP